MFDSANPPPFLIKHQIPHHTADRQLRIFLDGIILKILIAAIAIDQISPVGITRANSAAESETHRGALDIQWLVIFEHSERFRDINRSKISLDGLVKHGQPERLQKSTCLPQIRSFPE